MMEKHKKVADNRLFHSLTGLINKELSPTVSLPRSTNTIYTKMHTLQAKYSFQTGLMIS